MNSKILFEVTEEHLETGLRGFPVGYCTTSTVDPQKGLYYVGFPVKELAYRSPESVIYLLYHGVEGNEKQLKDFTEDLYRRSFCSKEVLKHIHLLPKNGHPMDLFSAAILILGMFEKSGDYREDCLNLIAKIPAIAAAVINHHLGSGETVQPKSQLGYMANFTQMLNIPKKSPTLTEVFSLFNILHFDHGGGNLSTFVGKAVASGLEDLYGSIAASMNALAGARHGGANQECLLFVQQMVDLLGSNATLEQVEKTIRERLDRGELVYGFGHAVLRVEDPRATVLYQYAESKYPNDPLVKMSLLIRESGSKVLKENPKISDPYPNVDAISGTLLSSAGFPYPEYYTVLFGLARAVGISIQIVYERCIARGGKGTPIVRPKYIYKPLKDV